ncbi:MAG: hypothetical protein C4291_15210, partial [Candidatus Dadabacteria bacterium]
MDMRRFGCIVLGFTLFAVVDGFLLGVFAGIYLQSSNAPSDLQLEPEEYAAYASDNNLVEAKQRLNMLDPDFTHTTKFLSDAAQHAQARNDLRHAGGFDPRLRTALVPRQRAAILPHIAAGGQPPQLQTGHGRA